MAYETILCETKGRVAIITLSRPDALNALNTQLVGELAEALTGYDRDDAIGAIVITGSEKAFAAGADIKEMAPKSFMDVYREDFAANWDVAARCRQARHRGCRRLLPRRRLRTCDAMRFHPGCGHSQVRTA